MIKHRGIHKNINFYFNIKNLQNPFNGGLGTNMRKAAHPSGGMDSSNPCRWRDGRLCNHGDGVCKVICAFFLCSHNLWLTSQGLLMVLLFVPHWRAPHHMCNTTYVNNCDEMNRIIPITIFLVMLFNACFMYQPKKDTNLLILALNRLDYRMTLTNDTFMNALNKLFARIKLYKFTIIFVHMTFL